MRTVNVKLTNAQIKELIIAAERKLVILNIYHHGKKQRAIITRALKNLNDAMKDMAGVV